MVTSLFTILRCKLSATLNVVTKVVTIVLVVPILPLKNTHSVAQCFFIIVCDTVRIDGELHLAQIDNPVFSIDEQIDLRTFGVFSLRRHISPR